MLFSIVKICSIVFDAWLFDSMLCAKLAPDTNNKNAAIVKMIGRTIQWSYHGDRRMSDLALSNLWIKSCAC